MLQQSRQGEQELVSTWDQRTGRKVASDSATWWLLLWMLAAFEVTWRTKQISYHNIAEVLIHSGIYIYIYIYIYICVCVCVCSHSETNCFIVSQLFSVARHVRFSKLGSKPGWLLCQSEIILHSHKEISISKGILEAYVSLFCFVYIYLLNGYQELNSFEELMVIINSFTRELKEGAYIVIHRQTVSLYHNSSVWLDKCFHATWFHPELMSEYSVP